MTSTLLLIQRQSLQLFISDKAAPVAVMVPESVIRDMEVVSEMGLVALFKQILPVVDVHIQAQITIIISEDLCFVAPFVAEKIEETQTKLQNESPFAHVAITTVMTPTTPVVVSTNQELYEAVGRVLEANHYVISGVYPWRALQLGEMAKPNAVFDVAATKRICESLSTYKSAAFEYKTVAPVVVVNSVTQSPAAKKKLPIGWIIFGVTALLYAAVMLFIMFRN